MGMSRHAPNAGNPPRHRKIYKTAVLIDGFVDRYKKGRKRRTFPHKEVKIIMHLIIPGSRYTGRGAFKTVHKVSSRARDLVLKTSNPKNIRSDVRAYRKLPSSIRNRYFAKVYWWTKYCLLQKFGRKARNVPDDAMRRLKEVGRKHGLADIRPENVRKVDGHYKIVDASVRKKRAVRRKRRRHGQWRG